MAHVVIDIAMSLDGYVAGPHDGPDKGLGENGGERIMESHMPSTHIRRTAARGNRCGVAPTATPLRRVMCNELNQQVRQVAQRSAKGVVDLLAAGVCCDLGRQTR